MSGRLDKVETTMNAQIDKLVPGPPIAKLVVHERVLLLIDKLDDGIRAGCVVHVISEAGRIDNGKIQLEPFFLEGCTDEGDIDCFGELAFSAFVLVCVFVQGG